MKLTRAEFALAIKCHRERLSLSQAELATVLQVSARTLWGWENERQCATWIEQIGVIAILEKQTKNRRLNEKTSTKTIPPEE